MAQIFTQGRGFLEGEIGNPNTGASAEISRLGRSVGSILTESVAEGFGNIFRNIKARVVSAVTDSPAVVDAVEEVKARELRKLAPWIVGGVITLLVLGFFIGRR